jgi:hypothetical protein
MSEVYESAGAAVECEASGHRSSRGSAMTASFGRCHSVDPVRSGDLR